jgi:dTDP-4-amino-4,6-dideoxygalactose transaminase
VLLPADEETGTRHARHLYTLLLDLDRSRMTRDELLAALHELGIGTGLHYRALHLHRYYRETYGYRVAISRTPSGSPSARCHCRCPRS